MVEALRLDSAGTVRLVTLCVLLLCGCASPSSHPRQQQPADSVASDRGAVVLQDHDGYEGRWLTNEHAEVFVAIEPKFRLLSLRKRGQASLMARSSEPHAGVRLAYMEPRQSKDSFDPGEQPGRLVACETSHAIAELQPSDQTQTRYRVEVSLADDAPRLSIALRLENLSDTTRAYAPWLLTSFPRTGRIIVPYGEEPRALRRLALPFWSRLPQQGLRWGFDALMMNLDEPLSGRAFKMGLATDSAWAAYQNGSRVLLSESPRIDHARYPEGNANLTLFQMDADGDAWAEIEHVGALVEIAPGDAAMLEVSLSLLVVEDSVDDPDEMRLMILAN